MNDVNCPYCNAENEINHDDGYGYQEDEIYQQECDSCDKTFTFTTSIIYYYTAEKAECLNGGEHDWNQTFTFPKECTMMHCSMCDEERNPTKIEMDKILTKKQ